MRHSAAIRGLDIADILKVQRVQIFPGIAVEVALLVIRTLSWNIFTHRLDDNLSCVL